MPVGPDTKSQSTGCTSVQHSVSFAVLTRRMRSPRQPRCRRLHAVRPEVLRPRLSTGLPLCEAGTMPHLAAGVMQTACQNNQLVDTVEIVSLTGSSVSRLRHDSCLHFPTVACAPDRRRGPKGLFSKTNGNVAGRRQRDLEKVRRLCCGALRRGRNPYKRRRKAVERPTVSSRLRRRDLATAQPRRQLKPCGRS
jgi:hypothetical protein